MEIFPDVAITDRIDCDICREALRNWQGPALTPNNEPALLELKNNELNHSN